MDAFEIMIAMAGVRTKEGELLAEVVKEVKTFSTSNHSAVVVFDNNMAAKVFVQHSSKVKVLFGIEKIGVSFRWSHIIESSSLREALIEIAKLYEF